MRYDGQKSLRDYFTREKHAVISAPSEINSACSPSGSKRSLSDDEVEPLSSTPARKKLSVRERVVVIESDEDEENIFERSTKYRNSNFFHSPSEASIFRGGRSRHRLSSSAGKKKSTRSRAGKWSCAVCTYSNHPLISYCEMCSAGRDSHPASSSAESLELEQSNPAVTSSSDVNRSTSDTHGEVSRPPFRRQNSDNRLSSPLRGSRTPSPCLFSESDADDEATEMSESSSGTARLSVISDTSLLKSLSIDSDKPTDACYVSSSHEDEHHATSDKAEFSSGLNIDFSNTAVHKLFQYSCSRNSSRIYLYDKVLSASALFCWLHCCNTGWSKTWIVFLFSHLFAFQRLSLLIVEIKKTTQLDMMHLNYTWCCCSSTSDPRCFCLFVLSTHSKQRICHKSCNTALLL